MERFSLGREVESQILRHERTELPAWAATALALPAGSRGVVLKRVA